MAREEIRRARKKGYSITSAVREKEKEEEENNTYR